jgi:hypothetical protein
MLRYIASGLLLASFTTNAAAETITTTCDLLPGGLQLNIYRADLTIDLVNQTVEVQQHSTIKENDGRIITYRNHKADPGVTADTDQFVLVSADRVRWGTDKPTNGLAKAYNIRDKTMTDMDGAAKYQCK